MERYEKDFQAYEENKENPEGTGHIDSQYEFLSRKLEEARTDIERSGVENTFQIQQTVKDIYRTREFNNNLNESIKNTRETLEEIQNKLKTALSIQDMRRASQLPADAEVDEFIKSQNEYLDAVKAEIGKTEQSIKINESHHTESLKDPRVMGAIESDAHQENKERSKDTPGDHVERKAA